MRGAKLSYDADTPLSELMASHPETIAVFQRYDMLCVGCLVGPFHCISDACFEHEVDAAEFEAALEAAVNPERDPR